LHRTAQLFEIELNLALRHIAGAVIQQTLGGVVTQAIAESARLRHGMPSFAGTST
jgi:hypothetical protein